ncbi:MAG: exo-beta-N-acetylmuramidase NamZ domain-containing protein, partial [Bacteroidota bacterium]
MSSLCFSQSPKIRLGIEVLRENNFNILKGKRVGLITNPTGVDSKLKATLDILFEAKDVQLVALFGPEHGVRGNFSAGDKIENTIDSATNLPMYSLYGKTRKPTSDM